MLIVPDWPRMTYVEYTRAMYRLLLAGAGVRVYRADDGVIGYASVQS